MELEDKPRYLTQENVERVKDLVFKATCQVCGGTKWSVGGEFLELRPFANGVLQTGGVTTAVALAVCDNCNQTIFIHAIRAGLLRLNE